MENSLELWQAKARFRMKNSGQAKFIQKQCKQVAAKLRKRPGAAADTPGQRKSRWAESLLTIVNTAPTPPLVPPWIPPTEDHIKMETNRSAAARQIQNGIKKHFADTWQNRWINYQQSVRGDPVAAQSEPLHRKKRLKLHEDLVKAESALAVQIRSEKIGFAKFLHTRRVPGVTSPECDCGWHSQTANHIIRWCPLRNDRDRLLANAETEDYRVLTTTSKGLKLTTKWLMQQNLLTQYALAAESLYLS